TTFNGEPAIKPKDEMYIQTLGSPFPSFTEYSMMNELYNCKELCKPDTSARCEMGGFPHPRDCTKCICPTGYGGVLCNERIYFFLELRIFRLNLLNGCTFATIARIAVPSWFSPYQKLLSSEDDYGKGSQER
ncbi:hypothetical protein TELCIR_21414, partial [Teladorsagia circumcincta]